MRIGYQTFTQPNGQGCLIVWAKQRSFKKVFNINICIKMTQNACSGSLSEGCHKHDLWWLVTESAVKHLSWRCLKSSHLFLSRSCSIGDWRALTQWDAMSLVIWGALLVAGCPMSWIAAASKTTNKSTWKTCNDSSFETCVVWSGPCGLVRQTQSGKSNALPTYGMNYSYAPSCWKTRMTMWVSAPPKKRTQRLNNNSLSPISFFPESVWAQGSSNSGGL